MLKLKLMCLHVELGINLVFFMYMLMASSLAMRSHIMYPDLVHL